MKHTNFLKNETEVTPLHRVHQKLKNIGDFSKKWVLLNYWRKKFGSYQEMIRGGWKGLEEDKEVKEWTDVSGGSRLAEN